MIPLQLTQVSTLHLCHCVWPVAKFVAEEHDLAQHIAKGRLCCESMAKCGDGSKANCLAPARVITCFIVESTETRGCGGVQ